MPVRPLRAGDVLQRAPGAPPEQHNHDDAVPLPVPEAHASLPGALVLPDGFRERVRRLTSNTMLHIPTQFRQQVCTITADNVEGANRGIEVYALLFFYESASQARFFSSAWLEK